MCVCVCVHAHAQSWSILCDPMNYRLPGSSVHRIFQARILKWVAISSSRGSSQSRDRTCVSCIGRQIPYHWGTWEDQYTHTHTYAKSLQLCPTLCNPMNYSLPVSSVHGILQARILEGVNFHALLQGIFPDPGIEPVSLTSPALTGGFITSATWEVTGKFITSATKRERGDGGCICIYMYLYTHI